MYKEDFVCIFALWDFYPNTLYTYLALLLPLSHHPSEWYLTPVINFYSCFNLQWLLTTVLLLWWPNSEAQKQLTKQTQRGTLKLTSVNAGKLKNRTPPTSLLTNVSFLQLPKSCEILLNKDLNFVPTPTTVNTTLIEVNIKRFNRKIRWMEYFHSNSPDETCSLFTLFVDFVLLFVCFV